MGDMHLKSSLQIEVRLLQYSRRVYIAGLKEKRKAFLVDLKHTQISHADQRFTLEKSVA
ncbi:hypothetical protein LguiA_001355 [Lonicera macranthoides]